MRALLLLTAVAACLVGCGDDGSSDSCDAEPDVGCSTTIPLERRLGCEVEADSTLSVLPSEPSAGDEVAVQFQPEVGEAAMTTVGATIEGCFDRQWRAMFSFFIPESGPGAELRDQAPAATEAPLPVSALERFTYTWPQRVGPGLVRVCKALISSSGSQQDVCTGVTPSR